MSEPELYLFTGPETGKKNDTICTLRETAAKKNNGALDVYKYYAGDTRMADIVAQLQNESLFTSATFIVLRNAEQIKLKADIDLLASWAKSASTSANTLILVSDENAVDKRIESLVPSSHKKIFWEMFENHKTQWLRDFFGKNGYSVTEEAVEAILDMIENNTESLRSECARFFYCFEKGHQISAEDVEQILAHNREENAFTLFEAMASSRPQNERFETSLEILQKIRLSREGNGVQLIAGLSYCFRQLRAWHALHAKGHIPSAADFQAAGFSGKKNQVRYRQAATVWNAGSAASVLALLSATDIAIREGGALLENTRLTLLLYAIIIKNGIYCAQYDRGA